MWGEMKKETTKRLKDRKRWWDKGPELRDRHKETWRQDYAHKEKETGWDAYANHLPILPFSKHLPSTCEAPSSVYSSKPGGLSPWARGKRQSSSQAIISMDSESWDAVIQDAPEVHRVRACTRTLSHTHTPTTPHPHYTTLNTCNIPKSQKHFCRVHHFSLEAHRILLEDVQIYVVFLQVWAQMGMASTIPRGGR